MVTATVRDAAGRIINHPSVTWTSSAPAVATVATVGPESEDRHGDRCEPGQRDHHGLERHRQRDSDITIGPQVPVASVTVTPPVANVVVQGTVQLAATLRDANGKVLLTRPTSWASNNPAVATVDANRPVTAVGAGSADRDCSQRNSKRDSDYHR